MNIPRLRVPYLETRILTLVLPEPSVIAVIIAMAHRVGVPADVLLAIVLVETALRFDRPPGILSALSARVARRLQVPPTSQEWAVELELAATLLACELERFGSLALALLSYHIGRPDWVAEQGDDMLAIPIYRAYIVAVLRALTWVSRLSPWPARLEVAS